MVGHVSHQHISMPVTPPHWHWGSGCCLTLSSSTCPQPCISIVTGWQCASIDFNIQTWNACPAWIAMLVHRFYALCSETSAIDFVLHGHNFLSMIFVPFYNPIHTKKKQLNLLRFRWWLFAFQKWKSMVSIIQCRHVCHRWTALTSFTSQEHFLNTSIAADNSILFVYKRIWLLFGSKVPVSTSALIPTHSDRQWQYFSVFRPQDKIQKKRIHTTVRNQSGNSS